MEAYLYESLKDNEVKCNLCNHRCNIKNGRRGICGVRENRSGILETLVYGKVIARQIEKLGISGLPTIIFFDAEGKELPGLRVVGFLRPEELLKRMGRR